MPLACSKKGVGDILSNTLTLNTGLFSGMLYHLLSLLNKVSVQLTCTSLMSQGTRTAILAAPLCNLGALLGVVRVPSGKITITPPASSRLLQALIDRKSTRLNSSHVRISYAVFCLKKKT